MRRLAIALVLLSAGASPFAQSLQERAERDELVRMADEDPAMRRAFERARATLDAFLEKAGNPPAGTSHYAVKVGIADGPAVEYFWLSPFSASGRGFVGTLNNEPRSVKTVKFGQRYEFGREQIVDWTYIDRKERRMVGNFTMCALLTKESASEAESMKKQYGLQCE